jgi:hypothetical protein
MDQDSLITCLAIGVLAVILIIGVARRAQRKKAGGGEDLDKPLLRWTPQDPFRIRDLLRSFCVQGASGSGKSSAVALQLARALLADRQIVFHIVASKPEDREWWQQRFAEAKRGEELRIVAPDSGMRYNMLDAELKAGADDREIANILMTSGETLRRTDATVGGGGENDQFFRDQSERMVEMAVLPLRLSTGTVRANDLQRFISGAAMTPDQLKDPNWRQGFHWKMLEAALNAPKTEIEKADMEQCTDYWLGQVPTLNDRTKTSIMVQVQGILHVMGSGVVRSLISSDTTLSPAMMDDGASILVDMPGSRYGASGQFVNAVWRLGVQRHVLRRHAKPGDRIIVQWIDEFQNHAFSGDTRYLAECRSHLGCQVVLTQSLHAFYAAIKGGRSGEHLADALLTNYGTKCFCALGDAKTAEYASSLVGKSLQTFVGGSMAPQTDLFDELMGRAKFTGSFSEHYENVLQTNAFMSGLRTGGAENGYMVDAIVIRSGETFSNGSNWLRVAFGQR